MTTKSLLKALHTLLSIVALIVFLAAPFISYGGKFEVSGADLLDYMDDSDVWLVLFIFTPILAALSNLADSKTLRGCASLTMFLPVLILLIKTEGDMELAAGGIIYCLLAVGLTVMGFASPEEPSKDKITNTSTNIDNGERNGKSTDLSSTDYSKEIREYDLQKLNEIASNASLYYKSELVKQCRQELLIREKATALIPQVKAMTDDQLQEKLDDPRLYSAELIYACQIELSERHRIVQEALERQAEQERIEREKKAEEERILQQKQEEATRARKAAAWRKWRPFVYAAIVLIIIVLVIIYLLSTSYRYKRGVKFAEKNQTEQAIEYLSTITNHDFKNYSTAHYLLYKQFLKLKDSAAAAQALTDAVSTQGWEDARPYRTYAQYCLNGSFAPHIAHNEWNAAKIYSTAPDPSIRLESGQIFFKNGFYSTAYKVFDGLSHDSRAKGYLGIMYLFGLGGQTRNLETAWDYLASAPDELPFVVYKGDLTLLLRKGKNSSYSMYSSIEMADSYYAIAAQLDPDNTAYATRYEVTRKIIAAKKKHDKINYWERGNTFWGSYTSNGCSYVGEIYRGSFGSQTANGWGCFTWKDSDEVRLGYYSSGKSNGNGINISKKGIIVGRLIGSTAVLVEGCYVGSDGNIQNGIWKNGRLVKGGKYNISGQFVETIK